MIKRNEDIFVGGDMRIYFAATEPHNSQPKNVLLSFWDMINTIPFRKATFKLIKEGWDEGQNGRASTEVKCS